ncbi:hypothetical protein O4J56_01220 [Nocardiopsis sp. RSe5-2]|uniref:Lipoprotein with Yx(FWY)xxD motif n=1 Tax=Nocardiopsis endophytica TaxID=3018445 RepID=A0ABT4TX29_9ACTN|nr:hypothetical protein [Nocardiopsis endophytica]MDA2809244.1 hypothetical protein [Nocardiopsis endophytica]
MKAPGTTALALAGGAAALLAAGCGGQAEMPEYDAAPAEGEAESSPDAPDGALAVREGTGVGEVVTDADGYTLYMYTPDGTEPAASSCTGDCAKQWPPALDEGGGEPEGIDADLVGSLDREEGESQVTLGGRPLYRYAGDVEPGDVNGEGVGGLWYAVAPDGGKAAEAVADSEGSGDSGGAEDTEDTEGSDGGGASEDSDGYGGGSGYGDDGGYGY